MARIYLKNHEKAEGSDGRPIYFIVPGFLGNYEEDFIANLSNFLKNKDADFWGVEFGGNGRDEEGERAMNLEQMSEQVAEEYKEFRAKHPSRQVIVLAYSQGVAITLKVASIFEENTEFILFCPAIFIGEIILPRIDSDSMRRISSGEIVITKVSRYKKREIDITWIESYKNFFLDDNISELKQEVVIVRGKDDYVEKKNVDFLMNKLKNVSYIEVPGDHSFSSPSSAFDDMVKVVFM